MKNNEIIRFRLPESLKKMIIQAAEKQGTTVSMFVRLKLETLLINESQK